MGVRSPLRPKRCAGADQHRSGTTGERINRSLSAQMKDSAGEAVTDEVRPAAASVRTISEVGTSVRTDTPLPPS